MVSLNLLPDVKKEYLKSQHTKNMFVAGSFLVTAASIAIVVLMALYVLGVQKLQIISSQDSIDKSITTLEETPDLAKLVTLENQLSVLPSLHESKAATTRLFNFLQVLTPNDVSLSTVAVNFENNTIDIRGSGKDFKAVNTFVDTLKNASFVYAENTNESALAFSSVVLDTIGKSDEEASFKVKFTNDPLIFDNTVSGLKLSVPNITSTRSETEKPNSLFDSSTIEEEQENE